MVKLIIILLESDFNDYIIIIMDKPVHLYHETVSNLKFSFISIVMRFVIKV